MAASTQSSRPVRLRRGDPAPKDSPAVMTEDPALREGADEERKPRGSLETGDIRGRSSTDEDGPSRGDEFTWRQVTPPGRGGGRHLGPERTPKG